MNSHVLGNEVIVYSFANSLDIRYQVKNKEKAKIAFDKYTNQYLTVDPNYNARYIHLHFIKQKFHLEIPICNKQIFKTKYFPFDIEQNTIIFFNHNEIARDRVFINIHVGH